LRFRRFCNFSHERSTIFRAGNGTPAVREWDRQSQRVMVMADGFAWNGRTYDSLSKVAFAITGTKWNGPRVARHAQTWFEPRAL